MHPRLQAEAAAANSRGSASGSKRQTLALPAPPPEPAESKPEHRACLDWLCQAVFAGGRLYMRQPSMLAHALHVLLAMWQVRRSQQCSLLNAAR